MGLSRALKAMAFPARRRFDNVTGTLVGSLCAMCGTRSWPGRAVCSHCGSDDIAEDALPRLGTLTAHTSVWVPRAGLPNPYVLGQVDFGSGAMVFGHVRGLDADASGGVLVRVVLSAEAAAVPRFWFEPEHRRDTPNGLTG